MANTPITKAPNRLPLLGNVAALATGRLSYLESLAPLGGIVELAVGPQKFYLVNDADLLHRMMTADSDKFDKGKLFENVRFFLGNGLLTCSRDDHRRQRRMIQPAFHHTALDTYARFMAEGAVEQVARYHDGEVLDIYREMQNLTMFIISKTIFSSAEFGFIGSELARVLPVFLKGILRQTIMPANFLNQIPTPANRAFRDARAGIRGAVGRAIEQYRAEGADRGDLMSLLLAARDTDGSRLSDELLIDQVVTFLMAGTESTASSMSWFLHAITREPHLEREISAEIAEVIGDRQVTIADIPKLPCLDRALRETLRLYHPVWFLTRRSIVPVTIDGNEFPAGVNFLYSLAMVHRDPHAYSDPLTFRPERWIDSTVPRNYFIPFGSGARKCIGDGFSMISMTLGLVALLQRWTFTPVSPEQVKPFAGAVLHPQNLQLRIGQREHATLSSTH